MKNVSNRLKNLFIFCGLLTGLFVAIIAGGYIWRGVFAVQLATILACGVSAVCYFYWRGVVHKAQLPMLGIELAVAIYVMALVTSWIFSPDSRQGLSRLFLLLGYIILSYMLADAFRAGLNKRLVVAAMLVSSGILLALASMEVYLRYQDWFKSVGSFSEWPPTAFRFVGFLGHPNALMTYANLIAPLCVVVIIKTKNFWVRCGAVLWFVFFMIAIPFSSARASWFGTATWGVGLAVLWLWETGMWKKLLGLANRRRLQVGLIFIIIILVVGVGAVFFYRYFAVHPSHGSSTFGGRYQMWMGAIQIWRHNFWFGSGPGRFPFEITNYDLTIPPSYWPSQAHNLAIQSLAEFGLVGSLSGLSLIIWSCRRMWMNYRQTKGEDRLWSRAILVALAGWLVQMIFDDQTAWAAVMVPFILLAGWLLTSGNAQDRPSENIGLNILSVPLGIIILISLYMLWNYRPFSTGLAQIKQGDHTGAIGLMQTSLRDSNFSYYHTQLALAYARKWGENKNIEDLAIARELLTESLGVEASPSLWWADLAVMDWYAGERVAAANHITRAIKLSPLEPSYILNYAWFMEESGRSEQAADAYQRVLSLRPEWAHHPFWQQTSFRQEILHGWLKNGIQEDDHPYPYSEKAFQFAVQGNENETIRNLAYARWLGEPEVEIQLVMNQLAEGTGDQQSLIKSFKTIEQLSKLDVLQTTNSFAPTYATWVNGMEGIDFDLVPGYLQLQTDYGQFTVWQKWIDYQVSQGMCDEAAKSARLLQTAIQGGSLLTEEPEFICP